jgi:integrase
MSLRVEPTEFGGPVDPRNLLRVVEAAAEKAGMQSVGVHTLRHSARVGWLEAGVQIKAVADLLGHSSISITGDVYGHTSDDTARAVVDGWSVRSDCEQTAVALPVALRTPRGHLFCSTRVCGNVSELRVLWSG